MPLSIADLLESLTELSAETEWVEFKETYSEPEEEGKDICALANSAAFHGVRAAYKVWGIEGSGHEVTGTDFNPRTKKKDNQPLDIWLRRMLTDNAHIEFMQGVFHDKNVVVLQIWPATNYPVRFEGTAYIRSNSSTQPLVPGSTSEIELWKRIRNEGYEDLVAAEDLEGEEVVELLEYEAYFDLLGMPRPFDVSLALHHFIEDGLIILQDDGRFSITNIGAILFAQKLSRFPLVRRKTLRIIRYFGNGRTCERREREMERGYALDLDVACEYIDGVLPTTEVVNGTRREMKNAFPQSAIRELIANALIHQDLSVSGAGPMVEIFDNRIEFTNPGVPLVRVERIVNDPPQSRNEKLSALMRRLGLCEEAGNGWDTIIEGCELYLLPAPKIGADSGTSTRITLFGKKGYRNMTPAERLEACYWHACVKYERDEYINNASLRARFGLQASSSAQISRLIKEAVEESLIRPLDPMTSPRYMVYMPYWA